MVAEEVAMEVWAVGQTSCGCGACAEDVAGVDEVAAAVHWGCSLRCLVFGVECSSGSSWGRLAVVTAARVAAARAAPHMARVVEVVLGGVVFLV